ncbi:beta-lactamase/transpeptidase-like protein [Bisporella sp. PMI_857]|nr:beta-lactamase/transpeptidase-like protein [Bisporella sp. PMI_857]
MESFEKRLTAATANLEIAGAVVASGNASRTFQYIHANGVASLKEGASEVIRDDAIFWIASLSKLMTGIAVLQCVERGQFTLDEDVTRILPELKNVEILKGFNKASGKPITLRATKIITLRHLLTHTSGLSYDIYNRRLQQWRKSRGEEANFTQGSLIWRYSTPLLFEPGESWEYGSGVDWAGQMLERANNMSLQDYMEKYIWLPLQIDDIAFRLDARPDMVWRMPDMSLRQGGLNKFGTALDPTKLVEYSPNRVWTPTGLRDDSGGAGGYGSVIDFMKVLHSLVANDGKVLSANMVNELFRPQLNSSSQAHMDSLVQVKERRNIMGIREAVKMGHSLGGIIALEDAEGLRSQGTMSWQGLPNIYWWADRAAGVYGVFATQIIPTGDPKTLELFEEFERATYAEIKKNKAKGMTAKL